MTGIQSDCYEKSRIGFKQGKTSEIRIKLQIDEDNLDAQLTNKRKTQNTREKTRLNGTKLPVANFIVYDHSFARFQVFSSSIKRSIFPPITRLV